MVKRYWTDKEKRTVKFLLREKMTAEEIGLELGRSASSVQGFIYRNKLGLGKIGRPIDFNRAAVILDRLQQGMSMSDISRYLGVSTTPVKKTVHTLRRMGLVTKVGSRYCVTEKWIDRYRSD